MSTGILVALVVVGALACPLMMWWQNRRGRAAACCVPISSKPSEANVDDVRARQEALASRIAELQGGPEPAHSEARFQAEPSPPRG